MSTYVPGEHSQENVVDYEEREQRRLAARRERAEQRRQRFLNPCLRTRGVDKAALDTQIAERKRHLEEQKEEEMREAEEEARVRSALERFERQQEQERRRRDRQVTESCRLQMETRRVREEEERRMEKAATPSDGGTTSCLAFDGEDPREADRRALQAMQMRDWCAQQSAEKEDARRRERDAERAYGEQLREMEQHQNRIVEEMRKSQQEREHAAAEENARMAREKAEARRREREAELSSPPGAGAALPGLLEEPLEDRRSCLGPNRIRPDHYRGSSLQERVEVLREQQREAEERQAQRQREREREREFGEQQQRYVAQGRRIEAEMEQEDRRRREEYRRELVRQVAEKERRLAEERMDRNRAGMSDAFFGMFGQSDR